MSSLGYLQLFCPNTMKTAFVYDPVFLQHDPGPGHPECRERLIRIMEYISRKPWFNTLYQINPAPADRIWIEMIHDSHYVNRAMETCKSGAPYLDSMDVGVSKSSCETAIVAAGAPLVMADEILQGSNGVSNGFALVRPPGHHAEKDMALGFCLFNNIAILARYLQSHYALDKILILDWDVHHGNGTQHSFEEDPSVYYISIHQYPFYPGTGAHWETGTGRGNGATLNCPMPANSGEYEYETVFKEKIIPAIHRFKPEFILISAGFDAHKDDPLAQMNLGTGFYGWMTLRMLELADQYCNGRIISLLEGGYNLHALPLCIEEHLKQLTGISESV